MTHGAVGACHDVSIAFCGGLPMCSGPDATAPGRTSARLRPFYFMMLPRFWAPCIEAVYVSALVVGEGSLHAGATIAGKLSVRDSCGAHFSADA
jgi:hypothetical protein